MQDFPLLYYAPALDYEVDIAKKSSVSSSMWTLYAAKFWIYSCAVRCLFSSVTLITCNCVQATFYKFHINMISFWTYEATNDQINRVYIVLNNIHSEFQIRNNLLFDFIVLFNVLNRQWDTPKSRQIHTNSLNMYCLHGNKSNIKKY